MSDLISRESLKHRINLNYNIHQYIDTQSIKDIINTESSVEDKTVEELENIWEKIRALPDINPDYPMDKTIHISRYEVQKIIYERIAELKGEVE